MSGVGLHLNPRNFDATDDNVSRMSQFNRTGQNRIITPISYKQEIQGFIPPPSFVDNTAASCSQHDQDDG